MVVEMTQEGGAPAGATAEKVVTIEGKSKALDSLIKEQAVADPISEEEVKDAPKEEADEKQPGVREIPTEKKEEPVVEKKEGEQSQEKEEDQDVDLSELMLEVDGQDKSVKDLLTEGDALRKQLAEINKDPFLKGFIEHYMANGNANAYLEARGVDWDKKDDLDILKNKFERENSDLDPKIREKIWRRKLADEYKIKPDLTQEEMESEDYEIAQGLLKRDANKARSEFKETQKKFQVVERKPQEQTQQAFDPAAYKKQVLAEKDIDAFMKSKLLKLGIKNDSGQSFGYEPTNPEGIIEMMVDDRKFLRTFYNPETRQVDRTKQAKIYAYSMDPDGYEQQLVDFGKQLGLEERLKEVKNTDGRLTKKTTEAQTKDTTFAKRFLTEALKQKK